MIKISKKSLEKKKEEYEYKKNILIPQTAKEFQIAVNDGDGIHDNPMIRDKRFELDKLIDEVAKLEDTIHRARVIEKSNNSKIEIGSKIKMKDLITKQDKEVTLIDPAESGLVEGGITLNSPLGAALFNKKVGQVFKIKLPNGSTKQYEVLGIS